MSYLKTKNFRESMSGLGHYGSLGRTRQTVRRSIGAVPGLVDDDPSPLTALQQMAKPPAGMLVKPVVPSGGGGPLDFLKNIAGGAIDALKNLTGSAASTPAAPAYVAPSGMSTTTKLLIGAGVVGAGVLLIRRRK